MLTLGAMGAAAAPVQAINLDYFLPDDLLDVMNHLNTSIAELEKEILQSSNTSSDFYNSFSAFKDDWDTFYAARGPGFFQWFTRISNNVRDQIVNYIGQYNGWLTQYLATGAVVSPTIQTISTDKPEASLLDPLKNLGASVGLPTAHVAMGIGVIAAAAVGGWLLWTNKERIFGHG